MKRGRKKGASSGYMMNKHKNGNYFYAYTLRPFNEGDKVTYRRCQWGRLDEDLKFYPALSFVLLPQEEKDKFVFPKEWDISEIGRISDITSKPKNGQVENIPTSFSDYIQASQQVSNQEVTSDSAPKTSPNHNLLTHNIQRTNEVVTGSHAEKNAVFPKTNTHIASVSSNEDSGKSLNGEFLCGASWLVQIWTKRIGLVDDLLEAFNREEYYIDAFMSLVIYSLTHNFTLDNFYTTQSIMNYPSKEILGEEELGRISLRIGPKELEKFFRLWMERSRQGNICAFDSTLTGDLHDDSNPLGIRGNVFRYGYDIEDALKSEFIIMYSFSTGCPLCYIEYGEDNDVFQSFTHALSRLKLLGESDFTLFTNRRYDGVHLQVGLLANEGLKLLLPCDLDSNDVKRVIDQIDVYDHLPTDMHWDNKEEVYYLQVRSDYGSGKKVRPDSRINLYYSPEKDMRDRMKIQHRIGEMNANVGSLVGQSSMVFKEDFSKANNLIDIEYSTSASRQKFSGVKSGSINMDKVSEMTRNCGFFAARTFNLNYSPKDVLNVFRFASEHRKDFGILKDMLHLQRRYDEDKLPALRKIIQGKRFVLFLSLIISASLKRVLASNPILSEIFRDETQMIMEMMSLKGFYRDGKLIGCSPLTQRQKLIARELNLDQWTSNQMAQVTDLFHHLLAKDN